MDNDVFKRSKLSKDKLNKILGGFTGVKYNYENFEDFLVMHLSDHQVRNWHTICGHNNHFNNPMHGEQVVTAIQAILPQYTKGSLPEPLQITDELLDRLYKNQENPIIKFKSDFAAVIKQLLKITPLNSI